MTDHPSDAQRPRWHQWGAYACICADGRHGGKFGNADLEADLGRARELLDEAAEHVRHGSDRRERFDWLKRYDALPAADSAEESKLICRFYPNEPCPLPNVHCSAPKCMTVTSAAEGGKG
jgi:hypothetical protein